MGFDTAWFNELRTITQPVIATVAVTGIQGNYPHVGELHVNRAISTGFLNETISLVNQLNRTRFGISTFFKTTSRCPQHVYDYPKGRAYRMQWNIGFYAGDNPSDDRARIGIGFSINNKKSQQGIDEYVDFVLKNIAINQNAFDNTFRALGSYSEPDSIFANSTNLSAAVTSDLNNVDWDDDWRFFGKILKHSSPTDRAILNSVQQFANEAVKVFTQIRAAGFGY